MGRFYAQGSALLTLLCLTFVFMTAAHQPPPTSRRPPAELMPVTAAYGRALDSYAAGNWTEAIQYLEESLRSWRLRKEGARRCALRCNKSDHHEPSAAESNQELRAHWRVLTGARCQRECRAQFPALQLPPPATNVLEEFTRRSPYRYLHFAYARLRDLQRAVPCAHTFLQEMLQVMEAYTREYDVSGFLTDYEERPYEASFLKGVKLIVSGDYAGGVEPLEDALRLYVHEHELCQADRVAGRGALHASSRRLRRRVEVQAEVRGEPEAQRRRLLRGEVRGHRLPLPPVCLLQT
ncbi:endoplasmic reticulum protein SC65-like [Betta splendens]|uniref:Endoplasmic reticulum protein SC65-like n=1 Tax=Betta splendens TaxID=158456 RepID=A0A6P7L4B3_BETSP|nr:endoplasmic reticulum protein SC65-like [Betta splendens]